MRVVDQAQHGRLLRCLGEEGQRRDGDKERVRTPGRGGGQTECAPQRGCLGDRQPVDTVVERPEELMQSGERQLGF